MFTLAARASEINIVDTYSCYEDKSGTLSIDIVSDDSFQGNFGAASEGARKQSFSASTFWFKIEKPNLKKALNIISRNIFIDSLEFYYVKDGEWEVENEGLLILKPTDRLTPHFSIPTEAQGDVYYLSVKSSCLSQLDLWLVEDTDLLLKEADKTLFYVIITGLILIYFLISLFLYFFTKKKGFLFLGMYALSSILIILYMNGFVFKWFTLEGDYFYKWSFVWVLDFFLGSSLFFSYVIFEVKQVSKKMSTIYLALFIIVGLMLLSPLVIDRRVVSELHFFSPVIFISFNAFVGLYFFFRKKDVNGLYLGLGWFFYLMFSFIWTVTQMGHIERTFFTENATAFGFVVELIIFAVLGAKYYTQTMGDKMELENKIAGIEGKKAAMKNRYGEKIEALSKREIEVLVLISKGSLDKEIADKLAISVSSVRTYCNRIFTKLEVSNRTEASEIYHKMEVLGLA